MRSSRRYTPSPECSLIGRSGNDEQSESDPRRRLLLGLQDLIRNQPGVVSTRVGYSGGNIPNATYRNHGTHAEAVEIIFDPTVTDYRTLLEFFFQIHDPTTKDRQGNDRGPATGRPSSTSMSSKSGSRWTPSPMSRHPACGPARW